MTDKQPVSFFRWSWLIQLCLIYRLANTSKTTTSKSWSKMPSMNATMLTLPIQLASLANTLLVVERSVVATVLIRLLVEKSWIPEVTQLLKLMFMPMDSRSLLPQPPLHPVPVLVAMKPTNFVMVISQDTWERVF